jgi:hypothetical protein
MGMKFWKDTGSWNETLVQCCIFGSMLGLGVLGYRIWGLKGELPVFQLDS